MASPERNARQLCRLDAIPPHKTRCSNRDQQGTAGDAAKSKTWNPAQLLSLNRTFGSICFQKNILVRGEPSAVFTTVNRSSKKNAPASRGVLCRTKGSTLRTL